MKTLSLDYVIEVIRIFLPIVISLIALFYSRRNWMESNRPIITAFVETFSSGNQDITYKLTVMNSGARPAVNIRLTAEENKIRQCLAPKALSENNAGILRAVLRSFSSDGIIPILVNGKTTSTAFGYTGEAGGIGPFWQYKSSFPIEILYEDLEGRSYKSKLNLLIRDSEGFGGSTWEVSQ